MDCRAARTAKKAGSIAAPGLPPVVGNRRSFATRRKGSELARHADADAGILATGIAEAEGDRDGSVGVEPVCQ